MSREYLKVFEVLATMFPGFTDKKYEESANEVMDIMERAQDMEKVKEALGGS